MDFPFSDLLDEDRCYEWLLYHLHNGKLCCADCKGTNYRKHHVRRAPVVQYWCRECGRYFNIFTGSVFQKTQFSCSKIVLILRGIAKGESTAGLSRELKVDRANLLYLRHKLQENACLNCEKATLGDAETESDEMYQNAGEKGLLHPDPEDAPRRRANKKKGRATGAMTAPACWGRWGAAASKSGCKC